MTELLLETAEKLAVPVVIESLGAMAGSDADALAVANAGMPTALVSVTIRYMHSDVTQLVTDRAQRVERELCRLIRERPSHASPAAAIRGFVLGSVDAIAQIEPNVWRGEIGCLAITSPTVHRLSLEMTDRQAQAIAAAIRDTTPVSAEVARLRGIGLASVYQIIFDLAGRRTQDGHAPSLIVRELRPTIEAVLDDLERWTSEA